MKRIKTYIKAVILVSLAALLFSDAVFAQMNNLENKLRLARTYERNGDYEKAKELYIDLLQVQPWNQTYLRGLNNIYIKLKEYDKSINMLIDRITASPNDINAMGMLGATYYVMGEHELGFRTWDDALSVNSGNQVNYRIIANYAIENRAFDKAISILKSGKEVAKDPKMFSYDLANIYVANMNYKDATYEYCFILDSQPTQLNVIKNRIMNYFSRQGAAEASIGSVKEYIAVSDKSVFKELLSFLYLQNKQFDDALSIVVDLDEQKGAEGGVIFKFAMDAYRNREYKAASTAHKIIIDNYPTSGYLPSAKIGYARSGEAALDQKLSSGINNWKPYSYPDTSSAKEYEPIISSYRTLIELYPNDEIANESNFRIGKIKYERQGKFDEAREIFEELEKAAPASAYALLAVIKLGELYIIEGNLDAASTKYSKAFVDRRTKTPEKQYARFMQARLNFWEGDFAGATKKLANITANLSDNTANDAIELSMLINTTKQDSANLVKFANASFLAARHKYDDAAAEFKSLSENENAFILNVISKYKYSEMLIAEDKYNESIPVLRSIVEDQKSSLFSDKSLFMLANVYNYGLNDRKSALAEYQNLLEKYPNSLYFDKAREMINTLNAQTDEKI